MRRVHYFFFFNDTATTEIYTLSLHDALPISRSPNTSSSRSVSDLSIGCPEGSSGLEGRSVGDSSSRANRRSIFMRSEEHTSELQSRQYLVCRLLLEKKKILHLLTTNDPTSRT